MRGPRTLAWSFLVAKSSWWALCRECVYLVMCSAHNLDVLENLAENIYVIRTDAHVMWVWPRWSLYWLFVLWPGIINAHKTECLCPHKINTNNPNPCPAGHVLLTLKCPAPVVVAASPSLDFQQILFTRTVRANMDNSGAQETTLVLVLGGTACKSDSNRKYIPNDHSCK